MIAGKSSHNDWRGRPESHVGTALEKSLRSYAAAAAASGVSLLALTTAAEARIVYTPANIHIAANRAPFFLDLNHDGTADFSFRNAAYLYGSSSIRLLLTAGAQNPSNCVWGRGAFSGSLVPKHVFAWALHGGFKLGPNNSYFQGGIPWLMGYGFFGKWHDATYGQWLPTQRRYLGLKFMIGGHTHYGWARFNVTPAIGGAKTTLTGYAYETIPNKPITTGKTKGPDVITLEPATLGRLAQGASGIPAWRQKK